MVLAQLSALLSVDALRCSGVTCPGTAITNYSRHEHLSGVTKCEMVVSVVHPDIVNRLLEGILALMHSTYQFNVESDDDDGYPFKICQSLRQHAKGALKH